MVTTTKVLKPYRLQKNFFKEIVESLSTSDNKEDVSYNIKDNKNFLWVIMIK